MGRPRCCRSPAPAVPACRATRRRPLSDTCRGRSVGTGGARRRRSCRPQVRSPRAWPGDWSFQSTSNRGAARASDPAAASSRASRPASCARSGRARGPARSPARPHRHRRSTHSSRARSKSQPSPRIDRPSLPHRAAIPQSSPAHADPAAERKGRRRPRARPDVGTRRLRVRVEARCGTRAPSRRQSSRSSAPPSAAVRQSAASGFPRVLQGPADTQDPQNNGRGARQVDRDRTHRVRYVVRERQRRGHRRRARLEVNRTLGAGA